jgi:hypothetical protein
MPEPYRIATWSAPKASLPRTRRSSLDTSNSSALLNMRWRFSSGTLPQTGRPRDFELSALTLPAQLPITLPSELVHQRPDVQAAEAQLHAATPLTRACGRRSKLDLATAHCHQQLGRIW